MDQQTRYPCAIKHCPTVWSKTLVLHRLPHSELKRKLWLQLIKNYVKTPMPKPSSIYLCNLHFVTSDFQTGVASMKLRLNAYPSQFPPDPETVTQATALKDKETPPPVGAVVVEEPRPMRKGPQKRALQKNNVNTQPPRIDSSTPIVVLDDSSDEETSNKRLKTSHPSAPATALKVDLNKNTNNLEEPIILIDSDEEEDDDFSIAKLPEIITIDVEAEEEESSKDKLSSLGGHKPVVIKIEKDDSVSASSSSGSSNQGLTETSHKLKYFSYKKLNDNRIHYMTGMQRKSFDRLLKYCVDHKLSIKRLDQILPVPEQLLITLFKYRHNIDCNMISIMFHLSDKRRDQLIRDMVIHWTKALNAAFKTMDFFRHGAQSAKRFRAILHIEDFIIDEFSILSPGNRAKPLINKVRCLVKVAVAVDENGAVLGASKSFKNITPKEIFSYSGLMEKLRPGDHILTTQSLITMAELAKVHQFHVNEMLADPKEVGSKIQYLAAKTEIVKACMRNVKKCKILTQNCEFYRQTDDIIYNCLVLLSNWNNTSLMDRVLAKH